MVSGSRKWTALFVVLVIFAISALALIFHPEWRVRAQAYLLGDRRILLASIEGDLIGQGENYKVLKYQTRRGLIVEVLRSTGTEARPYEPVDQVIIPDRFDGFFHLAGQAARLALVDIDKDGQAEIVAPSFDENMVAHLNALRLNRDSRKLELVRPQGP